jgi:hypothetical protein
MHVTGLSSKVVQNSINNKIYLGNELIAEDFEE